MPDSCGATGLPLPLSKNLYHPCPHRLSWCEASRQTLDNAGAVYVYQCVVVTAFCITVLVDPDEPTYRQS